MNTGVEVTNGLTHRTYSKSAIAPNLLLQAKTRYKREQPDAHRASKGRIFDGV